MATPTETTAEPRTPLSRERVLQAAVALADEGGIDAVSMRKLGQQLGVEAMSLYNHVANKEEILGGMVDLVVAEIGTPSAEGDWQSRLRGAAMGAREVMVRHPWAPAVIEARKQGAPSPVVMKYFDAIIGIFVESGISIDLAHHALHVLGSRILGFTQELFEESDDLPESPEAAALMLQQMAGEFPNISALMKQIVHDEELILGSGCDDLVEFEFALDLILDGIERMREAA